jgi:asparagine synthase (glutamine-hydrolysing)
LWRYYQRLPSVVRRSFLPSLLARLPQDRSSAWKNNIRYASAFVKAAEWDEAARYESYVGVFSPEMRAQLFPAGSNGSQEGLPSEALRRYFSKCTSTDSLNRIIYTDIKTSLADDLLLLTDKTTMAASIECRAPFIDAELVELTSRVPFHFKVRGLSMKYLLKKVVEPWLPRAILRRKKRGFGAPMGSWLRKDLSFLVRETLSDTQVRKRGIFNPAAIEEIITAHESQRKDHTDHLLALISLELWSRIFLDGLDWQGVQGTAMAALERR